MESKVRRVVAAVGRTGTLAFRVAYDAYGEARHLPAKDINGDGKVDSADTAIAQNASGKKLGQPGYNPDADWDRDGIVSTRDVAQYGSTAYLAALPQGQLAPVASVADPLSAANARSDLNIGFSGYRFNGDIGAYTVRFRHYDPTPGMCRWLERDPAGYQDGPSLYSYLGRNPMAGTDPYGLFYSGSGITVIAPDQIRPPAGASELVNQPGYGLRPTLLPPDMPGHNEVLAWAEALSAIATTNAERGVDNGLGFWDSLLLSDSPLHLTLQTIGLVPFVGEVADGLDALVYLAEGDPANASISALAMVPVIGAKATAARRAVKMADVVGEARKARGGATAVRKGQQGEAAVRAIRDIGPKKPIVVNGRRRIPDGMNRTTLTEIKNVKSLSYTQQLRDYADYANENGLVFELWMPRGVEMSRTLRDEIDAGRIVPQWIPGT